MGKGSEIETKNEKLLLSFIKFITIESLKSLENLWQTENVRGDINLKKNEA